MLWYESVLSDEVGGRALIIKQLNLDHFGKFHGKEIDLNPGVNIIYGANRESLQCMRLFRVCCLVRNAFVGAVPDGMHIPNISRGKAEQAMKDGCA